MLSPELLRMWFAGEHIPGVLFACNDAVVLKDDALGDRKGAVISLLAVGTEPTFLVELSDGTDVEVAQASLRHLLL